MLYATEFSLPDHKGAPVFGAKEVKDLCNGVKYAVACKGLFRHVQQTEPRPTGFRAG